MLINENVENQIAESVEHFKVKELDAAALKEWFEANDASFGSDVQDISESKVDTVAAMAQLQEKYVNETNFSANVASFAPKLGALLRRISPKLVGLEIAGVQPVPTPDSAVYMVKGHYAGTSGTPADINTSIILVQDKTATIALSKGDQITSAGGAQGTVVYTEADYSKAIINVTTGTFVAGEEFDVGATFTDDGNEGIVKETYSNEAAFKQILPGYSGPYTTAQGEQLGAEMNQLSVSVVKQSIGVKTRKLKAELTLELIQDMQAQHGAAADREIMFFLETEIVNDMNQEIFDKYKEIAVQEPNFAIATQSNTQGRHAKEMYSGLYDRMLKDKINLSNRNRRGQGNIIVATAGVITALMSLEKFVDIKSTSGIKPTMNQASNYVGTLMDGTAVYQDWHSSNEYYLTIYKGQSAWDAGVIYSPYKPLEILEATNAQNFQPVMGIWTRYGLTVNELYDENAPGASVYASYRAVDFTDTPLNG